MEFSQFFFVLLVYMISTVTHTACGLQQRSISDLRRFQVEGVAARFEVNREALEQELQNRKERDNICGHDVNLQLPDHLPDAPYNTSYQGEAMFMYGNITDIGLSTDLLQGNLSGQVATSYRFVDTAIPVVIGNGRHGVLSLGMFTDCTHEVIYPYFTSLSAITHVDSIEEENDGTVTIRLGGDVIVFQVQRDVNVKAQKDIKIGIDFDKVMGEVIATTNYPLTFDWGCDLLDSDVNFCEVLREVRCELAAAEGDVCTLTSTGSSKRRPSSFTLIEMTGIFRQMLPYFAEIVPRESFEAEYIEREHSTGIIYPCLTPQACN